MPEFKLYKGQTELNVEIRCINDNMRLDQDQVDNLRRFNRFLFKEILRYQDFEFETSIGGSLFIVLKSITRDFSHLGYFFQRIFNLFKQINFKNSFSTLHLIDKLILFCVN